MSLHMWYFPESTTGPKVAMAKIGKAEGPEPFMVAF